MPLCPSLCLGGLSRALVLLCLNVVPWVRTSPPVLSCGSSAGLVLPPGQSFLLASLSSWPVLPPDRSPRPSLPAREGSSSSAGPSCSSFARPSCSSSAQLGGSSMPWFSRPLPGAGGALGRLLHAMVFLASSWRWGGALRLRALPGRGPPELIGGSFVSGLRRCWPSIWLGGP